jgi:hypothetical protein
MDRERVGTPEGKIPEAWIGQEVRGSNPLGSTPRIW